MIANVVLHFIVSLRMQIHFRHAPNLLQSVAELANDRRGLSHRPLVRHLDEARCYDVVVPEADLNKPSWVSFPSFTESRVLSRTQGLTGKA